MFCAGISVYNPLRKFTRKSARVGVIGIGGLGHLALQFARAMERRFTRSRRILINVTNLFSSVLMNLLFPPMPKTEADWRASWILFFRRLRLNSTGQLG